MAADLSHFQHANKGLFNNKRVDHDTFIVLVLYFINQLDSDLIFKSGGVLFQRLACLGEKGGVGKAASATILTSAIENG